MTDEPGEVDWVQLMDALEVAEELGLCPVGNGEALVTSAFQLPWPDLASHRVLSNVGVRKRCLCLMRHTPWLNL